LPLNDTVDDCPRGQHPISDLTTDGDRYTAPGNEGDLLRRQIKASDADLIHDHPVLCSSIEA
jgi:hypothetical protein